MTSWRSTIRAVMVRAAWGGTRVAVSAAGFGDEVVATEFAQVVCRLADCVPVAAGHGVDFVGEVGDGESLGGGGQGGDRCQGGARAWLVEVDAADVLRPMVEGWGSWSRIPSGMKATSTQSKVVQNRS